MQNDARFRADLKEYVSAKPKIMHRGQGTSEQCLCTGGNMHNCQPARFSAIHKRVAAKRAKAAASDSGFYPHSGLNRGSPFDQPCARAQKHTGEHLWQDVA